MKAAAEAQQTLLAKVKQSEAALADSQKATETLQTELEACKRQMKERSQELQQEVARLEGVVAAEKLSNEQRESKAAEQVRYTQVETG